MRVVKGDVARARGLDLVSTPGGRVTHAAKRQRDTSNGLPATAALCGRVMVGYTEDDHYGASVTCQACCRRLHPNG